MRYLVGVNALEIFKRRACMVYLIKICAVGVVLILRHDILLVKKLGGIAAAAGKLAAAAYRKLAEPYITGSRKAQIPRSADAECVKLHLVPFKQRHIGLLKRAQLKPALAVVGGLDAIASGVQTRVDRYAVYIPNLPEVYDSALAALKFVKRLRRVGIAETYERDGSVYERNNAESEGISPPEGAFRPVLEHRRGRGGAAEEKQPYEKQYQYRKNICKLHGEPPCENK